MASLLAFLAMAPQLHAFSTDTYTTQSVLSEGSWVRVSVDATGIHAISYSDLRKWGFSNPQAVNVYGYGGQRMSDRLSLANYIDDLPQLQCVHQGETLYFFASGPVTVTKGTDGVLYHTLNPYSEVGYYFLSDVDATQRDIPTEGRAETASNSITSFTELAWHEQELVSYGESGWKLFGEDFRYTTSGAFTFSLPGLVAGSEATVRVIFASTSSSSASLNITADGEALNAASISATSSSNYGTLTTADRKYSPSSTSTRIQLQYVPSGTVSAANLEGIDINYKRSIALYNGEITFDASQTGVTLTGADANTRVWDVTDPLNIIEMNLLASGDTRSWINDYTGTRNYVGWSTAGSFPSPVYVGSVDNQNLHDRSAGVPDMVIVSVREYLAQAERLAEHRRQQGLKVTVAELQEVLNEFGSGVADVNAIRHYLKMLYDCSTDTSALKYALLIGCASHDNRGLTSTIKALNLPLLPTWQSDESMRESSSYTTDDIYAFLRDDSGQRFATDALCIGVGRIPARSLSDMKEYVDKVIAYDARTGNWKNRVLMLADDGDKAVHMTQTESEIEAMQSAPLGGNILVDKVYLDAFPLNASTCTDGRERLHRLLGDGVMWWNYIGHASKGYITGQNVMNYNDVNNLSLSQPPLFYGATCNFLQWDGADPSGVEVMAFNPDGILAGISATRSAYISENALLSNAMGAALASTDSNGEARRLGDVFCSAKNTLSELNNSSNSNKLRYVLLGDPSTPIPLPSRSAVIDMVGDEVVTDDATPTLMARQRAVIKGYIQTSDGLTDQAFSGAITAVLYDAELTTTTLGRNIDDTEGEVINFEEHGDMLWTGRDTVAAGEFTLTIAMPTDIADNFRPATLHLYALAADGAEAIGCSRQLYVYGYDDEAEDDTEPPTVDYAWLNHESFVQGGTVGDNPVFMAGVSDNVGVNLSLAGVGHVMTLRLDETTTYADVANYYTPLAGGASGTIQYPLSNLSVGNHTLDFKVWDTSGNSTTHRLEFYVQPGHAPKVYDIYTDVNPASTEANFYITHDRPDAQLTVSLTIHDMLGRMVWTSTSTGRSDMFTSAPITWDLTDMAGRRVPRGIYLYQAIVKEGDSAPQSSDAKRIAVTSR